MTEKYKKLIKKYFALILFSTIFFSCTLNYDGKEKKFKKMPNFVFKKATLDRYEENKLSLRINFKELEIYDSEKTWAGQEIHFFKIKKDEPLQTEKLPIESKGFAGLIKIDETNEKYFLGEKVFFENTKENLIISGKSFFWDKKQNILYSESNSEVSVRKGTEFNITGKGFIANTLSREFEFTNSIRGTIQTEIETDSKTNEEENKDENKN